MFVMNCATPCQFLGSSENETQQIDQLKTQIINKSINEEKTQAIEIRNDPAVWCSSCNVEMSQTRTKFKIEGLEESRQKATGENSGKLAEEVLPVIIYLCPKCGKIDLKADEKNKIL